MTSRLRQSLVGQDELPDRSHDNRCDDPDHTPLEFDDGPWEAFLPDDHFEPLPEPGDFWIERDQLNADLQFV